MINISFVGFFFLKNRILLFCDNVIMSFSGLRESAFEGDKNGRLYLTTHRMVFNNRNQKDGMKSFSFPFVAIRNVELEQPVFGANYIKGYKFSTDMFLTVSIHIHDKNIFSLY